jgi:hypothetical protein
MRLVPSNGSASLGGLGPSLGAAASLLAAGVTLSLLVASLFGVRLLPSLSDRGEAGSVRLSPAATPAARVAVREPEDRPRAAAVVRVESVATASPRRAARRERPGTVTAPRSRVAPRTNVPAPVATQAPAATRRAESAPAAVATPAPETKRPAPEPTAPPAATPVPTTAPPAGPVEKTVETVRETVKPVLTVVPPPVASPVQAVLDQVQATGRTVDETLRGLGLQHKP